MMAILAIAIATSCTSHEYYKYKIGVSQCVGGR